MILNLAAVLFFGLVDCFSVGGFGLGRVVVWCKDLTRISKRRGEGTRAIRNAAQMSGLTDVTFSRRNCFGETPTISLNRMQNDLGRKTQFFLWFPLRLNQRSAEGSLLFDAFFQNIVRMLFPVLVLNKWEITAVITDVLRQFRNGEFVHDMRIDIRNRIPYRKRRLHFILKLFNSFTISKQHSDK